MPDVVTANHDRDLLREQWIKAAVTDTGRYPPPPPTQAWANLALLCQPCNAEKNRHDAVTSSATTKEEEHAARSTFRHACSNDHVSVSRNGKGRTRSQITFHQEGDAMTRYCAMLLSWMLFFVPSLSSAGSITEVIDMESEMQRLTDLFKEQKFLDEDVHIPSLEEILPDEIDEIPEWNKQLVQSEIELSMFETCDKRANNVTGRPGERFDRVKARAVQSIRYISVIAWLYLLYAEGNMPGANVREAYDRRWSLYRDIMETLCIKGTEERQRQLAKQKESEMLKEVLNEKVKRVLNKVLQQERAKQAEIEKEMKKLKGVLNSALETAVNAVVSNISFHEVNKFSGDTMTNLQKEELWKNYKGKCVEWTGELVALDSNFFGGLTVEFKHLPDTRTADVYIGDVPESMKEKLLTWTKGKRYTYRARLRDYAGMIMPITADWGC